MGFLSTAYDNITLDAMLGSGHAAGWPNTVYLGLSSTTPNKDQSNVTEPVGMGYARVASSNTTANWGPAADAQKTNATGLAFAQATGDWGEMTDWVMFDALTGGSLIGAGALTEPTNITSGITPDFPIGMLNLGAD